MDTHAVTQDLRRHHLFSGLSDEQLATVVRHCTVIKLDEGQHLFEHGQSAERFFLVRRGQMKLYRLSAGGNEKVIDIVAAGQTFAEAMMFLHRPNYPVSAQALSAAELIAVENRAFTGVLRESTETCFRVLGDMSMRLRARLNEIEALTLQNATLRLVNYLLYQASLSDNPQEICLPAAKNVIASHLSVQPETLSRIFSNLSAAGLISVKGLTITIHDADGLRELSR